MIVVMIVTTCSFSFSSLQMFMTEGHHILVEPDKLQRGESIGKGAFATVYKAKMKKTSDEVLHVV